nr:RUS family member 1 [Anas platyrhynchos]
MVTRIVFAWLQGPSLDCEAKQWRLAADVINDLGLSAVAVAGGATRAAVGRAPGPQGERGRGERQGWQPGDAGERRGAAAGAAAAAPAGGAAMAELAAGGPAGGRPPGLQPEGGGGPLHAHPQQAPPPPRPGRGLRGSPAPKAQATPPGGDVIDLPVPGPEEVNPREPLLPGFSTRLRLHLGAPLHRLVKSVAELRKAAECGTRDYLIVLRPSQGWVGVGLRHGAPPDTPLRACAHALLLEELLGPELPPGAPMGAALRRLQQRLRRCPPGSVPWAALAESSRIWDDVIGPAFLRGLANAGWLTERHQLAPDEWRLDWAGLGGGVSGEKPRPP